MKSQFRQKGAALLIILTLAVTAAAVVLTSVLSVNALRTKASKKSVESLNLAYKAVIGYALNATPPGKLPCPDSDGDGYENVVGVQCAVQLGRLPYASLNLPKLVDGYNNLVWYSINLNLRSSSGFRLNSSTNSSLTLDGRGVPFVLISPGRALEHQTRDGNSSIGDYLEGMNADADTNTFSRVLNADHNDILLSMDYQKYWSLLEGSVLQRIGTMLRQYRNACGVYPWAASYGVSPYNSVDALQQGNVPFEQALPTDWGSGCASSIEPLDWMATEWGQEIYFSMCTSAQGDCLTVAGDIPASASAVLVSPGVALSGQSRPTLSLGDYYEGDNVSADGSFTMRSEIHFDGGFNDIVITVPP